MNTELQTRQVLIVEDKESAASETIASAIDRLIQALEDKDISVQIAESYCEAFPVVETNMDIDCFLVASDMDYDKASESRAAKPRRQTFFIGVTPFRGILPRSKETATVKIIAEGRI